MGIHGRHRRRKALHRIGERKPEGTKKSEPTGVKPDTEWVRKPELKKASDLFKTASNSSKPVADSPSNRTRGAKRKAEEPSDIEGPHRRRKLQLPSDDDDESTEETAGETLGSDDETTASSDSGGGTEQSTPTHKQDDSTPESKRKRRKFGGQIVEEEPKSSVDGEAEADLNPLLGALEEAASRLGVPELTTIATDVLEELTGQEEPQLNTVMGEGHVDPEQTEWEPENARPAHIRKNTKDVRVSTMVNQAVTSEIHHLEKRIQENEAAIRVSDRELATARKAAPVEMNPGGTRVTQAQAQTATGLLIQMETLNPNQRRSMQAASVPVQQQGHPVLARTSSNGNPVVNGRISLPPMITSGLAANPVRTSNHVAVPIGITTTASVPAMVIPSSSVQVSATMATSAADQQAAVSAPDMTQEQMPIPVTTTTPAVVTSTQADGARYSQEYQRDVKGKQLEEPAIVKLNQHFGNMANPLRPWEITRSRAQIPSLHMNELLRGDVSSQPPPRPAGVLKQRADSILRPRLQQVQTPGAGASRPHSGCTKERQASGSGELPGDTPATAIDPEETDSPPKATPTTGS
ncbi:hypothetical protein R1sor_013669 [Riccia sorocarpa]|uniref:Uncharacterized protein n=1 Tax=Riccia sorocarpa TaxID=122646 RepID=A0ABD3H794_9MARC